MLRSKVLEEVPDVTDGLAVLVAGGLGDSLAESVHDIKTLSEAEEMWHLRLALPEAETLRSFSWFSNSSTFCCRFLTGPTNVAYVHSRLRKIQGPHAGLPASQA